MNLLRPQSQSLPELGLPQALADQLIHAAYSSESISGLTHNFYRYPARFSPALVRAAIHAFTRPGDLILDPFVGGGTTLVEALASGRHGVGSDISALAAFVSGVKTTIYTESELRKLRRCDLRRFFVATQAVSLGSMVAVSIQFRRTSAGGW